MNRDEAVNLVLSILKKNIDGIEVSENKMSQTLVELGVDSLDVMLVIMEVCEAAKVSISDEQAEDLDTPDKIVEFISQQQI